MPDISHSAKSQQIAIDGGKMDGFGEILGCRAANDYACYTQFDPSQIPNAAALARAFAVSDRTFSLSAVPSWGAHLELAAGSLDGFLTGKTLKGEVPPGSGWGCDSNRDALWAPPGGATSIEPSCVPKRDGSGPYRPSQVPWIPTIMDRLANNGLSWRIYAAKAAVLKTGTDR